MVEEQLAFGWAEDPNPPEDACLPQIAPLADRLQQLASRGIYIGTSSWKYPGWIGQVYNGSRYQTRGRHSQRKFEQTCLAEYANIFPTVGGDFSFYQFPSEAMWKGLFAQVNKGFRFGLKIPEEVTVERYPSLPRYGPRAGTDNPDFLNAGLLMREFLEPLDQYRDKLGVLMFEFGRIREGPLREPARFADALDAFLTQLPPDRFNFAVEVRNSSYVESDDYFDCLEKNGVAHCFNSWTHMPPIVEQIERAGSIKTAHVVARCLLKPGRVYQEAVNLFSPYERIQEPYPEGRAGLRALIEMCLSQKQALFAFVNNRFEGNAVDTIRAVLGEDD